MTDPYWVVKPPAMCEHEWEPVSMVFETQLLDGDGRVVVRQPDLHEGRVYLVCRACASHTYMTTSFVGYRLSGSQDANPQYVSDKDGRPVENPQYVADGYHRPGYHAGPDHDDNEGGKI